MIFQRNTANVIGRRVGIIGGHLTVILSGNFIAAIAIFLVAASLSSTNAWAVSADKNKAVVLELIESIFNSQSLELVDELVHPNLVQHASPKLPSGISGFKLHYGKIFKRFRTYKIDVRQITGDEEYVSVLGRLHGTTNGNNKINFTVSDFYRLKDGKIIEIWRVRQLIEK